MTEILYSIGILALYAAGIWFAKVTDDPDSIIYGFDGFGPGTYIYPKEKK